MHNIRLNFEKLKNGFKNIDKKKAISTILVIALVVSSLGLLGSLFGRSSGGSSGGSSVGSGNNQKNPLISYYSISFDSNGGMGVMENQFVPNIGSGLIYSYLKSNTFIHSVDGWYFAGWNTKPDGSGDSYIDGDYIAVSSNMILYAQWVKDVTISYYKIYGCEWPTVYPPAENSGPINNDNGNDYLIATLDGKSLPYLNDYFTVDESDVDLIPPTSVVRTERAKVGSTLYIELNNKYDGDLCAIYVNGELVGGKSQSCNYPFTIPDSSNITITFKWVTTGVVGVNPQSFWVCEITYN